MNVFLNARIPFAPESSASDLADTGHANASAIPDDVPRFVFCSPSVERGKWLADALPDWEPLLQRPADMPTMKDRLMTLEPQLVFLDFSTGANASTDLCSDEGNVTAIADLARVLAQTMPEVPLIAVGSASCAEGAIAALRAGVHDFIDITAPVADAQETVLKVLARLKQAQQAASARPVRARLITLLGVRTGVGATTLAAHLADLAQKRCAQTHPATPGTPGASRVALLDLGLPVGDGQLYLNSNSSFHFVDAVHNLRRIDETFIHTALGRSGDNVTVISLPRNLAEMRGVAHADALSLLERLRQHFDVLIADLGGFTNAEFINSLNSAADETWLVTDQSVGALVSLSNLLIDPTGQRIPHHNLRLIVNRYDERYGMSPTQIASRFELPLIATLPDATLGLMSSSGQGKLLHQVARRDKYVHAVEDLVDTLVAKKDESAHHASGFSRWLHKK